MSDTPRVILLMWPGAGYDRGILRGIARYARHHGPWWFLLAEDRPELPSLTARVIEGGVPRHLPLLDFHSIGATGIIGRLNTPRIAKAVLASGLPMIAMDLTDEQLSKRNPLSRVSEIRPDSHKAGRIAAEHLLDRGFRRFAFCGYPGENWSRDREEGFRRRLQEVGLGCDAFPLPRRRARLPWHQEQPAITAWLKSLRKPVGVMTCNDHRGSQVIEACAIAGIHVPDQVAVVGVDEDRILSELSMPALSSVALNAEQGGYRAAELLDGMMSRRVKRRQRILVDALWVVARPSTDVIAIEDRDVAKAVAYVRDNARRPIGVKDVVRHLTLSRRALEVRFRNNVGRSIREEIQRVRLNWTKQLLAETDLPVSKIAHTTGFSSAGYLSKVFRQATGTTPAEYRRDHRSS